MTEMNLSTLYLNAMTTIARDKAAKINVDKRAAGFMLMLALAFVAVMPELAMAAPWDSTADNVLAIFTGGLTRTLAIIAVIACGIAAVAGKLSWDWAIKIIVGIVLIFGSAAIVDYVIAAAEA